MKLTDEQRHIYNERNKQKAKDIRALAKKVTEAQVAVTRPIQVTIYGATPDMIAMIVNAMESN